MDLDMAAGPWPLSDDEQRIVEREERLLGLLREAADEARARSPEAVPDLRAPYFAHLRVDTGQKQRDLLLGFRTFIDAARGITVLDWRSAPLAEVFFRYDEGDWYEEEHAQRTLQGRVEQKLVVLFSDGELRSIEGTSRLLRRDEGGWRAWPRASTVRLSGGEGSPGSALVRGRDGEPGRRIPLIVESLLDSEQRAVVETVGQRPLLVLGGAGSGKTTVALHRLVRLHRLDPVRYAEDKLAVVVPEPGLSRLCAAILHEMGLERIGVFCFDDWVVKQGRAVLRDLPRQVFQDPPGLVVKLKRHPALRSVLPRIVDRLTASASLRLQRRLQGGSSEGLRLEQQKGRTPLERLQTLENRLIAAAPSRHYKAIRTAIAEERTRLFQVRDDLLRLFGDEELMTAVAAASHGELTPTAVRTVLEHTRVQFSPTSEKAFAHVDAERLEAVDGRQLDEGTPMEVAGTIDVEDIAVAFELLRLKTGGSRTPKGRLSQYSHLIIDEAQDLAPIELGLLGRTLAQGAGVTISGDEAQQLDSDACFQTWEQALAELGQLEARPIHLHTSYRCPAPVTAFAHDLLGPLAPPQMPRAARDGVPVRRDIFASEAHAAYALCHALVDLQDREPEATVAVIARTPEAAQRQFKMLNRSLPVRLVRRGEFSFTPGIDVTDAAEVKGLEFDVVILPDVGPGQYPDEPALRRLLHVAATRAIHQLWVMSVGRPSPILPPA